MKKNPTLLKKPFENQKFFSHKLPKKVTTYFSIFNLFRLKELWPYYKKHVNQIILICIILSLALQIFEAFIQILFIVIFSLNQTLRTVLLYVKQIWMAQLILAISLWEVIFLWSETVTVLCARSHSLCKGRISFCKGFISRNLCRFSLVFHSVACRGLK